MNRRGPDCAADLRRAQLFAARDTHNGIDFVEVSADQRSLCLHFFGAVPALMDAEHPGDLAPAHVRIEGGARIRDIRVLSLHLDQGADEEHDDCLHVELDKAGDFSTYRVCVDAPSHPLDPRYASAPFGFKADCPGQLDCAAPPCAPVAKAGPRIDYLAKDYASFRQLMLDRLALIMPGWRERHAADLGIALVEVLAYAGDHLSYYQDAVATEAYLNTARQRISVRRHARLVDYAMHEGLNARAWVSVDIDAEQVSLPAAGVAFITAFDGLDAARGSVLHADDIAHVPASRYQWFEPMQSAERILYGAHGTIAFYTWGDAQCCIAAGATSATLDDDGCRLRLQVGEVLVFEEVKGPRTGNPADADILRRHAVRLTSVTPARDELLGQRDLVEIAWAMQDALPFSLCLSTRLPAPGCERIDGVSVARGNVLLVDHGRSVRDAQEACVTSTSVAGECACEGSVTEVTALAERLSFTLRQAPLTFADPLAPLESAAQAFERVLSEGAAQAVLTGRPAHADADAVPEPDWRWLPQPHLLDSLPDDRHFVAEIDDQGAARIRFGDGELGRQPAAGTRFRAAYRVGNGPGGNVGAGAIAYMVLDQRWHGAALTPRNPLPAGGGVAPEPLDDVRLAAPQAFRRRLGRAVTAADYAQLAGGHPALQRAAAQLRWTGSWYEARVAIDPLHTEQAGAALTESVERLLHPYRRIGHDLDVVGASYVPLDIELEVCAAPHMAASAVKAAALASLRAMFQPDRLTFGASIYLSQLVAAVQALDGVVQARVLRLQRLYMGPARELESGVLTIGAHEVAQLADDPNFPERGTLKVTMRGGR
jgi:Baseplate J-like protein